MHKNLFDYNIKQGISGENRIIDYVTREFGYQATRVPCDNQEKYDIKFDRGDRESILVEVKTDYRAHETEHFFIETANKYGKPSGLTTSTADYYILLIANTETAYVIRRKQLRKLVKNHSGKKRCFPTQATLIPVDDVEEIGDVWDLNCPNQVVS